MWTALIVLVVTMVASAALTGVVLSWLKRRAILDHPNDRSSHTVPTPRGGGWGILLTVLPAWMFVGWATGQMMSLAPILLGAVALAAVSWADDRRSLPLGTRLLAQGAAVALGLWTLPGDALVFQGWFPWWLDRLVTGLGWLWFVNLFNFMDGIDGLAGGEAASIGLGLALVGALADRDPMTADWLALAIAGAALGFLVWNWHPAKLFMGDVGSIPLGYLLGWLLVGLAAEGWLPAALLLPLYFLADATITLLKRLVQGKRVWQAHREHFYQKAVQHGVPHSQVVRQVLTANGALLGLALLSMQAGWGPVPAGIMVVGVLLWRLARPPTA